FGFYLPTTIKTAFLNLLAIELSAEAPPQRHLTGIGLDSLDSMTDSSEEDWRRSLVIRRSGGTAYRFSRGCIHCAPLARSPVCPEDRAGYSRRNQFPVKLRGPMPLRSPTARLQRKRWRAALLLILLTAIGISLSPARAADFTDAAGRRVMLPEPIGRVMAAS